MLFDKGQILSICLPLSPSHLTGVDVEDLKKATYDRFGPKSDYESAVNAAYAGTKEKKRESSTVFHDSTQMILPPLPSLK